jgi:hypothetical protein
VAFASALGHFAAANEMLVNKTDVDPHASFPLNGRLAIFVGKVFLRRLVVVAGPYKTLGRQHQ